MNIPQSEPSSSIDNTLDAYEKLNQFVQYTNELICNDYPETCISLQTPEQAAEEARNVDPILAIRLEERSKALAESNTAGISINILSNSRDDIIAIMRSLKNFAAANNGTSRSNMDIPQDSISIQHLDPYVVSKDTTNTIRFYGMSCNRVFYFNVD